MSFEPNLEIGQIISNADINRIFGVDKQQGIRTSTKYNYIVIVSKNINNPYPDKWVDDYTIEYTGVGQRNLGDQKLVGRNMTLANANKDKKELFFFDIEAEKECTYRGKCHLVGEPHFIKQYYEDGSSRKVLSFVLKLENKRRNFTVNKIIKAAYLEAAAQFDDKFNELSEKDLDDGEFEYNREPEKKEKPLIKENVKVYVRNKKKAKNALKKADFECEYNREHKSFIRKNSTKRYTEPHHLVPMEYSDLFENSLDVEQNIVSLCGECHKRIHYGKDRFKLIEKLYIDRKELLKEKGIDINLEELKSMYK